MPPEERLRQYAQEWLQRAKGNLARAKQAKPAEAFWEDYCFDALQAAEKAVKAVLTLRGTDFPKSHDIAELLSLLNPKDVPDALWAADGLTEYAVVTRYPGRKPPVSEEECRQAIALAEQVVRWAEGIVHGR
jgi:HEPN domain-containing protein